MKRRNPIKPAPIDFEKSPVPGVPVEVIHFVMTLPDEVRQWLGNFLLDSTDEGFDGTAETSAQLWKDELKRRCEDAEAHPEKLLSSEECFRRLKERIEQLRRTPCPDNLHGYHCSDYFGEGWAEKGYYHEASQCWVISPLRDLLPEQRLGFFAVGRAGFDGILFGYRFGDHGLWAFYPIGEEFVFKAHTLAELVESGTITV